MSPAFFWIWAKVICLIARAARCSKNLLKFDMQFPVARIAMRFLLFKGGLRRIYGRHLGATAANPSQSPFAKGEVLRLTRVILQ
jgi:hypothetical protein